MSRPQKKKALIQPGKAGSLRGKLIFKPSQRIGRGILRTHGGGGLRSMFWVEEITCMMAQPRERVRCVQEAPGTLWGQGKSTREDLAEQERVVVGGHASESHLYWVRDVVFCLLAWFSLRE